MKPIRNNRYRRRRQRSGSKTGIWLGALLAAGILAAAVVCLLLFLPRQDEEPLPSRFGVNPASQASEDPSSAGSGASGEPAYQSLYPDLYVPVVEKIPGKEGDKVVYLTFDDGPSSQTEALLDVLDEQGVKGTVGVYRDDNRDNQSGILLGALVEFLRKCHNIHAVLTQRRANRGRRRCFAGWDLELNKARNLLSH